MLKKIVLILSCLGHFSLTSAVEYSFQLAHDKYAETLITTLGSLKAEKAMLAKELDINKEKMLLLCSPTLLYVVLVCISELGYFTITKPIYYALCGFDFMVGYDFFARLVRFVYISSDIEAIEKELVDLIPHLETMNTKNEARPLGSLFISTP